MCLPTVLLFKGQRVTADIHLGASGQHMTMLRIIIATPPSYKQLQLYTSFGDWLRVHRLPEFVTDDYPL